MAAIASSSSVGPAGSYESPQRYPLFHIIVHMLDAADAALAGAGGDEAGSTAIPAAAVCDNLLLLLQPAASS